MSGQVKGPDLMELPCTGRIAAFSAEWTFMDIHGHLMTPVWEVPPE